jgi:hypothetical protein
MNTANYEDDWLEQGRSMRKKTVECKNFANGFVLVIFSILVFGALFL